MNGEKSNAFSDSGFQKVMINSGKATLKIHFCPFQEIELSEIFRTLTKRG